MTTALSFTALIILVALIFDVANGWHDAANSIATVVSTRVLSPGVAVAWAAFFNFVAFALFGTRVAQTIGGDLVDIERIAERWRLWVLLCGLIGAIVWDVITWYFGLPTSSSHALVGGYAGAAIVAYDGIAGVLKPAGWINSFAEDSCFRLRSTVWGTAGRTRKRRWALSPPCSSPAASTREPQNTSRCGSS